jgi:hypothetical protein
MVPIGRTTLRGRAPSLRRSQLGAGDRTRTDGLDHGKVALYHLSYTRAATRSNLRPERATGFEPATSSLEGSRSTN